MYEHLTRSQALGLPELFEDEPDRRAERIRAEVTTPTPILALVPTFAPALAFAPG